MHDLGGAHNVTAIDLTNALMTEADSEHRHPTGEMTDDLVGETGIFGAPGAGAYEHTIGGQCVDLLEGERIAAVHQWLSSEFAQILHEVEHERVVVVEHEDPGSHRPRPYRSHRLR